MVEAVHYDGYAVFIHAADTETVGAGTATFVHTDAGIVAHHIADVLHHFFIQLLVLLCYHFHLLYMFPINTTHHFIAFCAVLLPPSKSGDSVRLPCASISFFTE